MTKFVRQVIIYFEILIKRNAIKLLHEYIYINYQIAGTQDSRNEWESLSHLSKRSSKKDKIKQVSFNENSDNISASWANQIQNSRRNSKFEPFFDQL